MLPWLSAYLSFVLDALFWKASSVVASVSLTMLGERNCSRPGYSPSPLQYRHVNCMAHDGPIGSQSNLGLVAEWGLFPIDVRDMLALIGNDGRAIPTLAIRIRPHRLG
jgi:hypothetical protein